MKLAVLSDKVNELEYQVRLSLSEQSRLEGELQQTQNEVTDCEAVKEENAKLALEIEWCSFQLATLKEKHRANMKVL